MHLIEALVNIFTVLELEGDEGKCEGNEAANARPHGHLEDGRIELVDLGHISDPDEYQTEEDEAGGHPDLVKPEECLCSSLVCVVVTFVRTIIPPPIAVFFVIIVDPIPLVGDPSV